MYLNPRSSRDRRTSTNPSDRREDELSVLERSIKAVERQKRLVQEALEVRPLSSASLRGLVGDRRTLVLVNDGKDDEVIHGGSGGGGGGGSGDRLDYWTEEEKKGGDSDELGPYIHTSVAKPAAATTATAENAAPRRSKRTRTGAAEKAPPPGPQKKGKGWARTGWGKLETAVEAAGAAKAALHERLKATLLRLDERERKLRGRVLTHVLQEHQQQWRQHRHRQQHQHQPQQQQRQQIDGSYSFFNPIHNHGGEHLARSGSNHSAGGRRGQQHHNNRRRAGPLVLELQRRDSEFDDGRRQQRRWHQQEICSESSYFGSPTASSTVASAIAFSEARYHASLAQAAVSPSAFSNKRNQGGKRVKRFFVDGYSRGRLSGQSVAGGRVTGARERAGGPAAPTTGVEPSNALPPLFVRRRMKLRPAPQNVAPDAAAAAAAQPGERGRARHRSPVLPTARGASSRDAVFLPDGASPPAANPHVMMADRRRNNTARTSSERSKRWMSFPWRQTFMCCAGVGNAVYDPGSCGVAAEPRARSAEVGSWRESMRGSINRGRRSESARPHRSLENQQRQPETARVRPAVRTSSGSTGGGEVSGGGGGGDDEQPPFQPQTKNPVSLFNFRAVSLVTTSLTASPTTPAASAAVPLSHTMRGRPGLLTAAGSISGGGVSVDAEDEQPPNAGRQAKKSSRRTRRGSSVSDRSDSSATLAGVADLFLPHPLRGSRDELTADGSTSGGVASVAEDERPTAGQHSKKFTSGLPTRRGSSVSDRSDTSATLAAAAVSFLANPLREPPVVLTAADATSGGVVSVDGDHEQPRPGQQSNKSTSHVPPRRASSVPDRLGSSAVAANVLGLLRDETSRRQTRSTGDDSGDDGCGQARRDDGQPRAATENVEKPELLSLAPGTLSAALAAAVHAEVVAGSSNDS
eukprot:g8332.t1